MQRRLLIIPPLAGIIGCAPTSSIPVGVDCGPRPTQAEAEKAVQFWIGNVGLKDPGSAQIQGVVVGPQAGWVRGMVNGGGRDYGWEVWFQCNAKNGFGGYTGFRQQKLLICPHGEIRCAYVTE